jgi:hypothetical protein
VSAAAANGATRTMHRMTNASGAGRTGLAHLIELSAAGSLADAFVAVALAGTLFFSTSVTQARGRVALALLITMAPFALLAPFIGPLLDRVRHGRRYILVGTALARGLLCWGMAGAVQHNDTVTLLPAAFGVLLLQKAYSVTRASVTPPLLPAEITLVTANARCALAALIATSVGVPLAAGVDTLTGGSSAGAAWVLRVGTVLYLAAMVPGLRLPGGVDEPVAEPESRQAAGHSADPAGTGTRAARGAAHPAHQSAASGNGSGNGSPVRPPGQARRQRRGRLFPRPVGHVVGEAMCANASLRIFYGFIMFFLVFLLRTVHFGTASYKVDIAELLGSVALGGFVGTAAGSALRARAPQVMIFGMLVTTMVVTSACAAFFGLWTAVIVIFAAAFSQALVKLALDSIVQREISPDVRSSTFAASETLHQLAFVGGGLLGILMSLTGNGLLGLSAAAACMAFALGALVYSRRSRIMRARRAAVRPA